MRALALAAVLLAACGGPPPPPPPRPSGLERASIRALRAWTVATYELRLLGEPGAVAPAGRLEALEEERAQARAELARALVAGGADPSRAEDEGQLLPLVNEAARAGGRYALLLGDDPASFALVRVERDEERLARLFGETFAYRLVVHDETLVPDWPAWRAERLAGAGSLARPATWSAGGPGSSGVVRVDRAAIERRGAEQFLPRVDALRAAAARAADPEAFRGAAGPEHLPELVELCRAALRWRSLEQLWATLAARPAREQLAGFVADYALRAETRAACELRELLRLRPPGAATSPALTPEDQVRLQELGALSAMLHGEPLGVLADLLALVRAGSGTQAAAAPAVLAARHLVAELAAGLREGPASLEADALALWRLAGASPQELRRQAQALHQARLP